MKSTLGIARATWHGRSAYVLENRALHLVALTGGGHIAELRLDRPDGTRSANPLWTPPWKTIEPFRYRAARHARRFGTLTEGKLLSGLAGHNVCVDYFGLPSEEEAARGLSLHGEAPSSRWSLTRRSADRNRIRIELDVPLETAGLEFSRTIEMRANEPVVRFSETVTNVRAADHFFHWAQHVTLGPPFLTSTDASVALPGSRALTYPHGYDEGRALLASNAEFVWPEAPSARGGFVDLTRPLANPGLGFVVAVLLEPSADVAFVAAVNRKLRLLIAYCFRRADFPWVAVWEENHAIAAAPWRRRTAARGLEFSTTPLPVPRRDSFLSGPLFGERTLTYVPARGKKTVRYLAVLTDVPEDFSDVHGVSVEADGLRISDRAGRTRVVSASGLPAFLA